MFVFFTKRAVFLKLRFQARDDLVLVLARVGLNLAELSCKEIFLSALVCKFSFQLGDLKKKCKTK